jgi:hypothetical protein
LASLRVLDVGGADSDAAGRLFGDLGADVLKIEPPGGAADRLVRPTVAGAGVAFALHNAGKCSAILDVGRPRVDDGPVGGRAVAVQPLHYGRFASEYRRRYGRTPSETLRAR